MAGLTASWEDLAAVVFVGNKFLSSCVMSDFTTDFWRNNSGSIICDTFSPLLLSFE